MIKERMTNGCTENFQFKVDSCVEECKLIGKAAILISTISSTWSLQRNRNAL
ncbi:14418_t:CDS:1 [Cetraspora pellucida]|uniref:14418_t:CDS:1 n=1 Tax=Cetraspora pellucida TaxID=1433469 RepID=A0ACA9MV60_9GLOM|nr:14418_t:CDS:1 [Cetraspora pellucida]